jgi:SAM-dependent methyltransferase
MQLLQTLHEDGAFGCITFSYPGIGRVSRDLLESVIQINFLHKYVNVLARDDLRILDIGAGYGRMAHRMLEANSRIKSYTCVDAVPESTFLCEFYLKYRGLEKSVQVLPMDELEQRLSSYDLALNIHSFSECTYAAIEWWLRKLRQMQVRYLMIVPNSPTRFLSTEVDGSRRDFAPLLEELGYELIAQEPLFDDQAVREYMRVSDNMFLFDCQDCAP